MSVVCVCSALCCRFAHRSSLLHCRRIASCDGDLVAHAEESVAEDHGCALTRRWSGLEATPLHAVLVLLVASPAHLTPTQNDTQSDHTPHNACRQRDPITQWVTRVACLVHRVGSMLKEL